MTKQLFIKKNIVATIKITFFSLLFPFVTYAQTAKQIMDSIVDIFQDLVLFALGLGLLVFLWSIFKYSFSTSDDDKNKARQMMLWGLIALLVMTMLWGFVRILNQTFFKTDESPSIDLLQQQIDATSAQPQSQSSASSGGTGVIKITNGIVKVVETTFPVIILAGVLFFLWSVLQYSLIEDADKGKATSQIGWGVLILFILISVWGLVAAIGQTAGVSVSGSGNAPSNTKVDPQSLIVR